MLKRRVDGTLFSVSNIYGPTSAFLKYDFFLELRLCGSRAVEAWVLLGDFNVLLWLSDKNGPPSNVAEMLSFRRVVSDLGLFDHPILNGAFTWTNGRPSPTLERLDRALTSRDWNLAFPRSTLRALPRPRSDHSPLVLTAFTFVPSAHLFRFETLWLRFPTITELVSSAWLSSPTAAEPTARFAS